MSSHLLVLFVPVSPLSPCPPAPSPPCPPCPWALSISLSPCPPISFSSCPMSALFPCPSLPASPVSPSSPCPLCPLAPLVLVSSLFLPMSLSSSSPMSCPSPCPPIPMSPCPPMSPRVPQPGRRSHEPVADGAEVFGEPDGEDDAGDEEEGAAAQAEPEGVLQGEPTALSGARSARGAAPRSGGFREPRCSPNSSPEPRQGGSLPRARRCGRTG